MNRNGKLLFCCRDLRVRVADQEIVKGVDLGVPVDGPFKPEYYRY